MILVLILPIYTSWVVDLVGIEQLPCEEGVSHIDNYLQIIVAFVGYCTFRDDIHQEIDVGWWVVENWQ